MTTVGSLVKVWTDVGARKPVPLLAKIIEKDGIILVIRYLSENKDGIWRYEEDTYEVEDRPESIAEHLQTDREEDAGFAVCEDGFIKTESDDDYVPDSDEDEESEDETEDESEEDEEIEEEESDEDDDSDSEETLDE